MALKPTTLTDVGMVAHQPDESHAPSYLPKEKQWKLVWRDEFDGDALDERIWNYRLHFWGQRACNFTDEGVEVADGVLSLKMVRHGDDFASAQLQTGSLTYDLPREAGATGFWPFGKMRQPGFMHKYGFYEIRCRLPKHPGWHAAFWLQAPGIGSHPDPACCGVECDIMENYRQHVSGEIICGNGWGGYGKDSRWFGHYAFPYEETDDGWHYYAVDWSPEGYIFYADGKEVGRQMAPDCAVSQVEQFILVTTECHGYLRKFASGGAGTPTPVGAPVPELFDAYPDRFDVDFVRVYDSIES